MLIGLGGLRIYQELTAGSRQAHNHPHDREAYSIGLIHGLAGSGALILLVLTDLTDTSLAIAYLVVFGIGSANNGGGSPVKGFHLLMVFASIPAAFITALSP